MDDLFQAYFKSWQVHFPNVAKLLEAVALLWLCLKKVCAAVLNVSYTVVGLENDTNKLVMWIWSLLSSITND